MPKLYPKPKLISTIAFGIGLFSAAAVALGLETAPNRAAAPIFLEEGAAAANQAFQKIKPRPLSEAELKAAKIAWVYFENNTNSATGWVNAANNFPSATLWDQGSYLLGLVAAVRLGVISKQEFDQRGAKFISSLHKILLIKEKLPNKVYNTGNLMMTNYINDPMPEGIGWSSLDIARLMVGLRALESEHPALSDEIAALYRRWDLSYMTHLGFLQGAEVYEGVVKPVQEGRIGYEQYGARGAALAGLDVMNAIGARDKLAWRNIGAVRVGVDRRQFADYGAITPVLSEPYMLNGLEFGFDSESSYLARQVYLAQKRRFEISGVLTAVSEDHINKAPYFIYSSVFANGQNWQVTDEKGVSYNQYRILSTKAAFSWHAIYDDDYTAKIRAKIWGLANVEKGWAAGIYEKGGAVNSSIVLNTNAVILEALHYRAFGPILSPKRRAIPSLAVLQAPSTKQKPASAPASKPAPAVEQKPAPASAPASKPAPAVEQKPASKPSASSKPTPKPSASSKPTPKPSASSKPTPKKKLGSSEKSVQTSPKTEG